MNVWDGINPAHIYPKTLSLEDRKRSEELTQKLFDRLAKRPVKKIGNFRLQLSGLRHVECPLQFSIYMGSEEGRLATVGFYLQHENGEVKLVINNVQGIRGKQEQLAALSKQVGENWRVWAVKRMKRISNATKAQVAGSLPPLFFLFGAESSPQAYKRQIRQYKQTFRKAGVAQVFSDKVTKQYPESSREVWRAVTQERKNKMKAQLKR